MDKPKEELFNNNLNLVHYIIHNKFNDINIPGCDYEDLVQIGNIGLWKACKTFNHDKNIKFSTYAIKVITNEILQNIRKNKRNIILNNSISLNEIVTNNYGDETEFGNMLYEPETDKEFSIVELENYIYNKYKKSEIKLNIIKSYVFEGMSQYEIGHKYAYSQPHISRIIKQFKFCLKKDFERNELL